MTGQVIPSLVVPARFCGPPRSGNGGYTAGAFADHVADLATPVTVRLRQPPPLDAEMQVVARGDGGGDGGGNGGGGGWTASFGGSVVAQARLAEGPVPVEIDPVDPEQALAAEAAYPGLTSHPFPTCVVCGTDREAGDGLRIFPGPVGLAEDGSARVATTWRPHPSLVADGADGLGQAVTWAALDCIGGWAGDLGARLMVLGEMTARVDALPTVGEPHVVVGQARGTEGRRTSTSSTLYDADGRVVATAEHIWVAVDPADFA